MALLETLGFGSASKVIGAPYPLGGFEGFELSLASEFIPLGEVKDMGLQPSGSNVLRYVTLNLGKGIFYDVDTYFFFTILQETGPLAVYGGQLRWGFYRWQDVPLTASLVFHGSGANFENLLFTRTLGLSLYATYHWQWLKIYGGIGQTRSIGTFAGGDVTSANAPIPLDGIETNRDRFGLQTTAGISVEWQSYFIAAEWNRFFQSNYALKIGSRF